MEKVLVFRFVSDRLPVLDVQYGQIVDGQFQPFDNMFEDLNHDLHYVALTCFESDLLGTKVLAKAGNFGTLLFSLYRMHEPFCVYDVEMYPSFIVFHLKFDKNEPQEENTQAR